MPPKSVQFLIDECLKGKFDSVFDIITTEKFKIETSSAIKIITAICHSCEKNVSTPEKLNELALERLLKLLLKFIELTSDANYESYIKSVYYILKLLIEKKNWDSIVRLEQLFVPPFKPLILTEKHIAVYKNISSNIYNVIVKIVQNKDKRHMGALNDLCHLLTRICNKINNKMKLLETIHNCLIAHTILKSGPQDLLNYYEFALTQITNCDTSFYPQILKNFTLIYTNLLKSESNGSASASYTLTQTKLKTLYPTPEFDLLGEIMQVVEWGPLEGPQMSLTMYQMTHNAAPFLTALCELISSVASTRLQLFKADFKLWQGGAELQQQYYNFMGAIAQILLKYDIEGALRVFNTVGGLGRLAIVNSQQSKSYKLDVLKYLDLFVENLDVFKSQSDKWGEFWYDLGVHLYTIGVHLNKKNDEMFEIYLRKFVQTFYKFEGLNSSIINKTYPIAALQLISENYLKCQNYEKSLLFTSLSIIFGGDRKSEIQRWILTKVEAKEHKAESKIQQLTLISVLRKNENEIRSFLPKFDKIELLEFELRSYSERWKSKISMCSVLDELSHLTEPVRIGKVITEIWAGGDLPVHETFPKILCHVIERFEKVRKCSVLAHLYYLKHKYKVKESVLKHCEEMASTLNSVNEAKPGYEPNDECDLVSSYESLKLSRYLVLIKDLEKSLDLCRKQFSNTREQFSNSREQFSNTCEQFSNSREQFSNICEQFSNTCEQFSNSCEHFYRLLVNIGHEYSLHGDKLRALEAWQMAYDVAQKPVEKLESIGFIIEFCDPSQPHIRKLIDEGEAQIECVKTQKQYNELITYLLCKCEAFFDSNFEISYTAFNRISNLRKSHNLSDILTAKYYMIEHKFLTLPCDYGVQGHEEFSLVRIHQASYKATAYFNQSRCTSFEMRIFFEIFENLARMYTDLRLPLQVRSLVKSPVIIAQKMLLPFRTAAILYYLAYADILTSRFDDARVKIRDFSDILGVRKSELDLNKRIDELCEELVLLEVPSREAQSTETGSPTFQTESFKPVFLQHETMCECYNCMSFEYREYVLKLGFLSGFLSLCEEKMTPAKDFFTNVVTTYKFTKNNHSSFIEKWSKKISTDLVPPLTSLLETYCLVLLSWSNCALKFGRVSSAEKMNKTVLKNLEPLTSKFPHLYYEALAQKLDIFKFDNFEESHLQVEESEDLGVKTPENRVSKVVISPNLVPKTVEKFRIKPKSLKFDEDEDKEEEKAKKGPVLAEDEESNFKTPAASSSKVKKGSVLTEKQVENEVLASRTKLLTDRLRNSSRKKVKKEAKEVRTNLFQDTENTEKCLRRTRSRK
ncbi:uncharacterized protein LOC123009588 [Tribolium madens]|uniref:uncharacterized protein LOC123009588 n=1 Tax=Tribolium madens TaxID=41895 RepID=UPI001CF72FF4|nr:uncharacterized protein LOC123009588 [Tribolium madens]